MKEFTIRIDADSLGSGLKPSESMLVNSNYLESMINVSPEKGIGAKQYLSPIMPFSAETLDLYDVRLNFPNPVLVKSDRFWLVDKSRVFQVEDDWSLLQVPVYKYKEVSPFSVPVGNKWRFAPYGRGDGFLLANGRCMLFTIGNLLYGVDKPVRAVSSFRGRLLMGGFDEENNFFTGWSNKLKGFGEGEPVLKKSTVLWSSIGGGDLSWLVSPDDADGGYVLDPLFLETFRQNQFGFMHLPQIGEIINILELGNVLMVYGSAGIVSLKPFYNEYGSGFGVEPILSLGVIEAGGDRYKHTFIDEYGNLWIINSELKYERLGYRKYLSQLTPPLSINHDFERVFISDGFRTFVFNGGLFETEQIITSIVASGRGYCFGTVLDDQAQFMLETDYFDLGLPGHKSVSQVSVSGFLPENVEAFVIVSYKDGSSKLVGPVRLNSSGVAAIKAVGDKFKVRLRGRYQLSIYEISLSISLVDRRYRRGYVGPNE